MSQNIYHEVSGLKLNSPYAPSKCDYVIELIYSQKMVHIYSLFSFAISKFSASNFSRISSTLKSLFHPYAAKTASSSRLWPDNPTTCPGVSCRGSVHYPGVLPGRCVRRVLDLSIRIAQDMFYCTFNSILCSYGFSD